MGDGSMLIRDTIVLQIRQVAKDQEKTLASITDDLILLESGLDSLGFAILVSRLEDELGVDPFSTSDNVDFPVTFGEFVKSYLDCIEPSEDAAE
jgi:acyl carrier protein